MKSIVLFFASLGLIVSSVGGFSLTVGNTTYSIIDGNYTWEEARVDAINRGGHLATITSHSEWESIISLLDSANIPDATLAIGGTDQNSEGNWEWITGESWDVDYWHPNEPNNSGDGGATESYLGIWTPSIGDSTYYWHDYNNHANSDQKSYILETVPEPSTCALLLGGTVLGYVYCRKKSRTKIPQ